MLTLDDIKYISFRKSGLGGYKTEDVDQFIDEVQDSYAKLLNEIEELKEKMSVMVQKIEKYKDEEECIRTTLLSAQKLADSSIREAKRKAEIIIKDASIKGEQIVFEAKSKTVSAERQFDLLKQSVSDFKQDIIEKYKEHLRLIDSLPSIDSKKECISYSDSEETELKTADIRKEEKKVSDEKKHISRKSNTAREKSNKEVKLKFGENYSLDEDKDESPIGIFDEL